MSIEDMWNAAIMITEDDLNPSENFDKRLSELEYAYVKKKSRNIDGQDIPQIGLFLRPEFPPAQKNTILLEEEPLAFFWEGEYDIDEGHFPIESSLAKLSGEEKAVYNTLYCSPELREVMGVDEGRWLTNRFRTIIDTSHKATNFAFQRPALVLEAVYRHASCIDHSCMNSNAKYRITLRQRETTTREDPFKKSSPSSVIPYMQIIATRDIQPNEEILIHYDYEQYHHPETGRRIKTSESVHSDLYHTRGLLCGQDCILRADVGEVPNRPSTWIVTSNVSRRILIPSSPTTIFHKRMG